MSNDDFGDVPDLRDISCCPPDCDLQTWIKKLVKSWEREQTGLDEAIEYAAKNLPAANKYWIDLSVENGYAGVELFHRTGYAQFTILDTGPTNSSETLGEAVRRLVEVARKHAENEL